MTAIRREKEMKAWRREEKIQADRIDQSKVERFKLRLVSTPPLSAGPQSKLAFPQRGRIVTTLLWRCHPEEGEKPSEGPYEVCKAVVW